MVMFRETMNQEVNRKKMMMSDLDCYREIFSKWLLISPVLFTFVLITFSSLWFVALWLSSDSHCCKIHTFSNFFSQGSSDSDGERKDECFACDTKNCMKFSCLDLGVKENTCERIDNH